MLRTCEVVQMDDGLQRADLLEICDLDSPTFGGVCCTTGSPPKELRCLPCSLMGCVSVVLSRFGGDFLRAQDIVSFFEKVKRIGRNIVEGLFDSAGPANLDQVCGGAFA
jgi:hypothetical protein